MSERGKAQVSEGLASSASRKCRAFLSHSDLQRTEVQLLEEISGAKSKGALCVIRYNPCVTQSTSPVREPLWIVGPSVIVEPPPAGMIY